MYLKYILLEKDSRKV